MKILLAIFLVTFLLFFVFVKITINDFYKPTLIQRIIICGICGLFVALIIGLPVLGIMFLLR